MSKNTIKINGARLKELIEKSERTIYSIAIESGYSRNLIAEAIRKGQASPVVVNCLKLYGIHPEEYELKEETPVEEPRPEGEQLSFDDLASISRDELKEIVKEALVDVLDSFKASELNGEYDPIENVYTLRIYMGRR